MVRNLTLQTATATDDGLENKRSWADSGSHVVTLVPATASELRRAELLGQAITHTAFVPKGLSLSTHNHRFEDEAAGQYLRLVIVNNAPMRDVVWLELVDSNTEA